MWCHQVHFRAKIGLPQTTFSCPRKMEKYKSAFRHLFHFDYYFERWTIRTLARPSSFTCISTIHQLHAISARFQVFFTTTMDPIITSVTKQDPVENEEALIDRDADVFYVEITISPIFVSRRNLSDKVGRCIPFLEAVQATIVPYPVKIAFLFPKFIGWCIEQYSHEERVVVNKRGSKVLCRVESLSIRKSLGIPKYFSAIS
jgi:hypothetical protein